MIYGYARVSTLDQKLDIQRAELLKYGCEKIFEEKISGAKYNRPELQNLLKILKSGDMIVITKLDRLARSTHDLLKITEHLKTVNVGLKSIGETWLDTTTHAGKLIFLVFAGIAEFERALILERTSAGIKAAHEQGIKFGRHFKLNSDQTNHAKELIEKGNSYRETARILNCHHTCLTRTLNRIAAR